MALRLAVHLPRLVVLGIVLLLASATLTYGAAKRLTAVPAKQTVPTAVPSVVVPDVTGQAFVFAKGTLEDEGFAWRVTGGIHGYAANKVATQSPAAGTKLRDTGAPTISVSLSRGSYAEAGEPEDVSPYSGTAVVLAYVEPVVLPAPVVPATPVLPAAPKKAVAPAVKQAAKRLPAFVSKGAPNEPLKEIPLTERAKRLTTWLAAHPQRTDANVRHFLYQHAWIVTGATFGWWHGAQALKLLIAADRRVAAVWGVGRKSELVARKALAQVGARSK